MVIDRDLGGGLTSAWGSAGRLQEPSMGEKIRHMPEEQGVLLQAFVGSLFAAERLPHALCKLLVALGGLRRLLLGGPHSLQKQKGFEGGYGNIHIANMQI